MLESVLNYLTQHPEVQLAMAGCAVNAVTWALEVAYKSPKLEPLVSVFTAIFPAPADLVTALGRLFAQLRRPR